MAGWTIAFEKGGIAAMQKHFPEDEFSIYVHGHSTGGPFTMMLSQRVPNIRGILAIENSSSGYINRAKHAWGGELGKIDGFNRVQDKEVLLPLNPLLNPFLLLELFTFNIRGMKKTLSGTILTACGLFSKLPLGSINPQGSNKWIEALSSVYPQKYRNAVNWARLILCFHGTVILISLVNN